MRRILNKDLNRFMSLSRGRQIRESEEKALVAVFCYASYANCTQKQKMCDYSLAKYL